LAKREPKPPSAESLLERKAFELLDTYGKKYGFPATIMLSMLEGEEPVIIVSVTPRGELTPELKAEITTVITEAISPLKLSIYFVDQLPYRKPHIFTPR
jgi:hypothetical protein